MNCYISINNIYLFYYLYTINKCIKCEDIIAFTIVILYKIMNSIDTILI